MAAACLSRVALADLTLATAVTPNPVEPGESFMMALTVTNTDTFDRSDVVLSLRYPEQLSALAYRFASDGGVCAPGNVYCDPNETLAWSLGTLRAGEGRTVTVPPSVLADVPSGSAVDFARIEVTDSSGGLVSASYVLPVVADRALELAVTEAIEPVQPGGDLSYRLSYGHSKASAQVTDAELELKLPAAVSLVSASGGGIYADGYVRWALGTLGPGEGGRQEVVVAVDASVSPGTALEAQARLSAASQTDSVIRELTRVEAEAPLRLAVEAAPDPAAPDELARLALTVSNVSAFARSDVTLRLRYPLGLADLRNAYISDDGTCSAFGNAYCNPMEWATWSLGDLAAGAGVTVTLPPNIASDAMAGALVSLRPVATDSSGLHVESGRTILVGESSLELAVAEARDPVQPGDTLTLDISASNSQPSTSATGLRLELPLPPHTGLDSVSGGGLLQGDRLVWDLGALDASEVAQRRVLLTVDPAAPLGSLLASQARLTGAGRPEVRDDMVSRVASEVPLRSIIEVRDPEFAAQPGDTLDTWLTVESLSSFARSHVMLHLRYPEYLDALRNDFISDEGGCEAFGNAYCDTREWAAWTFGSFAATGLEEVDLPPVVSADVVPGSLVFFDATVSDSTARSRAEYVFPVGTIVDEPAPADAFRLQVAVSGNGTVTSAPSGILCPGACGADYLAGTAVTLAAEPGTGASFTGWSGDCVGANPTCSLDMAAARSVSASFQGGDTPVERDTPWQVAEIYIATMGYAPDNDGLQYWVDQIQTVVAWTPDTVAQSFFDQPLVQAQYPESAGFGPFIDALYRNIFGRGADSQGYDYWLAELQSGRVSRDQMINALINGGWANPSPEAQEDMQRFGNRVQVGLAFARYQAENGISYNQLSFDDQSALRQAGYDVLLNVTADAATRDAAIASIPGLLGPLAD
nr:DUF4214 domain-containing protein [Thiorhodococcus minor]